MKNMDELDKVISDIIDKVIPRAKPVKQKMLEKIQKGNKIESAIYLLIFRETANTFIELLKEQLKQDENTKLDAEAFDIIIGRAKKQLSEMEFAVLEKI